MDLITLAMTNIVPDNSVEFTATVVIAGIVIVVAMLVLLIIIFQIFGAVVSRTGANKGKKSKAKKVEDTPVLVESTPAPVAKANDGSVSGEIVAAISAAIYQLEGEGAVISSITPVSAPTPVRKQNPITCRNPWAQAAIVENTMSF